MRIGSLFTGYGGLDLAVMDVLGGELAWYSETEPAACTVLEAHYPGVPNLGDVTAVDWSTVPPVDVITAGYPCQPFSVIGNREGTHDTRHLWPYVAEAIRGLVPDLVVLENVAGHRTLGFGIVLSDLAGMGLNAEWGSVRASDAGAPHRRERLFVVAYAPDTPRVGHTWNAPRAIESFRPEDGDRPSQWKHYAPAIAHWGHVLGRPAPDPDEPAHDGRRRLAATFVEWVMGLPEGFVTDAPIRRRRKLALLGNGVVPQQGALALRLLLRRAAV